MLKIQTPQEFGLIRKVCGRQTLNTKLRSILYINKRQMLIEI